MCVCVQTLYARARALAYEISVGRSKNITEIATKTLADCNYSGMPALARTCVCVCERVLSAMLHLVRTRPSRIFKFLWVFIRKCSLGCVDRRTKTMPNTFCASASFRRLFEIFCLTRCATRFNPLDTIKNPRKFARTK